LQKSVKPEKLQTLFSSPDFSIKFNGQAAPFKKGQKSNPVQRVPKHIATYATAALSNLHSPAQKRLAIDLEAEHPESRMTSLEETSLTSTIPIPAPAVTPNRRPPHTTHPIRFTTTTTTTSAPSSLFLDSIKADYVL
jgi:hypothetical protein